MTRRPHLVLLAVILLAAGALRVWRVGEVPPGFQFDEAHNALDARRVLGGELPAFFPDNGGREPVLVYLDALAMKVLGPDNTVAAIRLVSALAGLLTVALMFRFGADFFGDGFLAVLGAGYLALSYWHLHFARYGIRAILAPLWVLAAVWTWWRWVGPTETDPAHAGDGRRQWTWALACGACLAGAFYSHPTGRLLPFILLGHALWRTLVNRRAAGRIWRGLAVAGGAAVLLSLPLLAYFAQHPDQFMAHPSDVSLAAVAAKDFGGSVASALAHNAGAIAGMFFLAGDPSTFHNLPDLPVFDPLSALLGLLGLALLLAGLVWGPRGRRDQAVLLGLWLVIMLLPTLLSDRPPNYSRAIAALPVIALLPALGLNWALGHLPPNRAAWRWGLAIVALTVAGLWTARHYFVDFANLDHVYYSYDVDKIDAYKALSALAKDNNVFLHPLWAEQATIAALNGPDGPVRMLDGRQSLVLGADGRDSLLAFPAREADKEDWLQQAEDAYAGAANAGEGDIRDAQGNTALLTLRVPASVAGDGEPPTDAPLEPELWTSARFGGMIEMLGYTIGEAMPGATLPITFTWRVQEPVTRNLTAFVHLLGPDGVAWGQEDREPAFASYPTSRWKPGERIIDRFGPVLSPDAKGPVTIRVGWYDATTGERLNVGEATEFNLKPVQVTP